MRLKKSFLLLGVIGLFIGLTNVNAESFTDEDIMYVLTQRDLSCAIEQNYEPIGYLENGDMILTNGLTSNTSTVQQNPLLDYNNYIKVNNKNECIKLEVDEFIEFVNSGLLPFYMIDSETYEAYEIILPLNIELEYVLTTDTKVNTEKTYYTYDASGDYYIEVDEPKDAEISTYYEALYYTLPNSTTINSSTTYYELVNGSFTVVSNPTSDNILKYRVRVEFKEEDFLSVVTTINKTVYDKINATNPIINVTKINNEYYIMAESSTDSSLVNYYTLNGELVAADTEIISKFNDLLTFVVTDSGTKIYNEKNELIYDAIDVKYLAESLDEYYGLVQTDDNKLYDLRVYMVTKGNNQTYASEDITITFSGQYSLLDKVYLNDVELDKENYTTAEGSTIITLKADYLDTLDIGTYKLKVTYTDGGHATATFTVGDRSISVLPDIANPPTFDGITTYLLLGTFSLIGLISSTIILKKRFN